MSEQRPERKRELTRYTVQDISHPAVGLRDVGRFVILAYGSSKDRPHLSSLPVDPFTRDGKNLSLSTRTYFYLTNCIAAPEAELSWSGRRCPIGLFLQLEEFYVRQLASIEARLALPAEPQATQRTA